MRLCGWELLVELAPFDDSDRVQARGLRATSQPERLALNNQAVQQSDELRAAFVEAVRG